MIEANPVKVVLGAFEFGNTDVLDYALAECKRQGKYQSAKNLAIMKGLDIDWLPEDEGTHLADNNTPMEY